MRQALQTKTFSKSVKKLHKNQKIELDKAVRSILEKPESGEQKKGDLAGVYIHKCKISHQLYLIAYTFDDKQITLLTIGSHENFYRDLKSSFQ